METLTGPARPRRPGHDGRAPRHTVGRKRFTRARRDGAPTRYGCGGGDGERRRRIRRVKTETFAHGREEIRVNNKKKKRRRYTDGVYENVVASLTYHERVRVRVLLCYVNVYCCLVIRVSLVRRRRRRRSTSDEGCCGDTHSHTRTHTAHTRTHTARARANDVPIYAHDVRTRARTRRAAHSPRDSNICQQVAAHGTPVGYDGGRRGP